MKIIVEGSKYPKRSTLWYSNHFGIDFKLVEKINKILYTWKSLQIQ
jgi:hypothetical protein